MTSVMTNWSYILKKPLVNVEEQCQGDRHTNDDTRPSNKKCPLWQAGNRGPINGVGPRRTLMIVAESPGPIDDDERAPFMGDDGDILDSILTELGIERDQVYLTYAVKCRAVKSKKHVDPDSEEVSYTYTKDSRTPRKEERLWCSHWLEEEIRRAAPKAILCLGKLPLQEVVRDSSLQIAKDHGRVHKVEYAIRLKSGGKWRTKNRHIPVVGTYDPSFLRRSKNSEYVADALQDIATVWNLAQSKTSFKLVSALSIVKRVDYSKKVKPFTRPGKIGVDLEWYGENPWDKEAKVICSSVSSGNTVVSFSGKTLRQFVPFLLRCKGTITGHNLASDLQWILVQLCRGRLERNKLLRRRFCDSMIVVSQYDHRIEPKALKHLCETRCKIRLEEPPWEGSGKHIDLRSVPLEKLLPYNATDSWGAVRVADHFLSLMDAGQKRITRFLCFDMLRTCVRSSFHGLKVSRRRVKEIMREEQQKEDRAAYKLSRIAPDVNLDSTDSIKEHIFGTLALPVLKKTEKTGSPALDKEVKVKLRKKDKSGFVKHLVRRDKARKFRTTYCENFLSFVRKTGCIHPRFIISKIKDVPDSNDGMRKGGTKTGRPIMVQPGFQTTPKGYAIREAIVSRFKEGVIAAWDFSQVELRVAADIARCGVMLDIFTNEKYDIHRFTASEIFGVKYKDVTDKQRSRGKTVNFSIIYGCTPQKLVTLFAQSGDRISLREATKIVDNWYARYPDFLRWQEEVRQRVLQDQYIRTPTGRIEYIYANTSTSQGRKGLRMAINAVIQSGASDLCNVSMCEMDRVFSTGTFEGRALLFGQVYDSIVGDFTGRIFPQCNDLAFDILSSAGRLVRPLGWRIEVPLKAECKTGTHLP